MALAASITPTFRVRCGLAADDPDASAKLIDGVEGEFQRRIFYPLADPKGFDVFPSAIIQFGPRWSVTKQAGGAINYTAPEGSLRLILVDEDREDGDHEASCREFGVYVGNLLNDLRSQFALSDALAATGIEQELEPSILSDAGSRNTFVWICGYLISWD